MNQRPSNEYLESMNINPATYDAIAEQMQFSAKEKALANAARAMGQNGLQAARSILNMRSK